MSSASKRFPVPVLIPIETAARELTYKTLLAARLAHSGLTCFLASKSAISLMIRKLNGFIYLDKGFHQGFSEALHQEIARQGGVVVNLDEEGAVDYPDSPSLKTRYAEPLFDGTKVVLFWGASQRSFVERNLGQRLMSEVDASVFITGHPRFELLKPGYRALYQDEVDGIKARLPSFILINTNMGFGNNIKGADHVLTSYRERFPAIDDMVAFDLEKRDLFVGLVREMANTLDRHIVFRPHPEEDLAFYEAAFADSERVKVLFEGSSIPWLLACDHMIHPDCTTAVEMLMLGRKPLSILPVESSDRFVTTLPMEASLRFTTSDDLIAYLQVHEQAECVESVDAYPFLESNFTYGSNAFDAVARAIEQAAGRVTPSDIKAPGILDRVRLIRREWALERSTESGAALIRNKLRGFNRKGVESAFALRSQLGLRSDGIRVSQLTRYLFKVYQKS